MNTQVTLLSSSIGFASVFGGMYTTWRGPLPDIIRYGAGETEIRNRILLDVRLGDYTTYATAATALRQL